MSYDVRVENVSVSRPTAVVRRRARAAELPKVVPHACGVVWGVMRAQHVSGAGRHVALYLDGEINLEVGVELEAPFAGHGEVVGSALPAGTVATAVHFGPYAQLGAAHGHWEDAWNSDPAKIRTDVFYLLKPTGQA